MQAYAHEELSIRDICRNTSMSARTLTYAFKEHAGMSPMRYLKARLKAGPFDSAADAKAMCRKLKRRRQYCEATVME